MGYANVEGHANVERHAETEAEHVYMGHICMGHVNMWACRCREACRDEGRARLYGARLNGAC
jgi:hypothetical protein